MRGAVKNYYLFLGVHSFLLGLFPFFLPVYLFKNGAGLDDISWFIAITGLAFSCTLFGFDYLRKGSYLLPLVLSLVLELLLLALLVLDTPLLLVAVVNGAYSCLYWTLQRILFLSGGSENNSGRRFGNFQIFILVVLQLGIFAGGLLLEHAGIMIVCLLSAGITATGIVVFWGKRNNLPFPVSLTEQQPLGPGVIARFTDTHNSKIVFIFDGLFLYLESYFWVISLFLMVGESFVRLGGVVIILAVILGAIFFVIKNRIDRMDTQRVYQVGVVLYMVSWTLRAVFESSLSQTIQMVLLLVIAFCTSFFRLTFNKRFFDLAKKNGENRYLFVKSHYSQLCIGVGFLLLGLGLGNNADNVLLLRNVYVAASILALFYFLYRYEAKTEPLR